MTWIGRDIAKADLYVSRRKTFLGDLAFGLVVTLVCSLLLIWALQPLRAQWANMTEHVQQVNQ